MKFFKMIILCFFLAPFSSFAKDQGHLISGSTDSKLSFFDYGNSYEGIFNFDLGYGYVFGDGIQLGGDVEVVFTSGQSFYHLVVGPTYNFNHDELEKSFFAGVKIGFSSSRLSGRSNTNTFAKIEAGKRFQLGEHVSYTPGVNISKDLDDHLLGPSFTFQILRFTLIF